MNNNCENLIFKVYKIDKDGVIVSAHQYEQDYYTRDIISKTSISTEEISMNLQLDSDKLNLSFRNFRCEDEENPAVSFMKLENNFNVNYESNRIFLNIPTMIRCQNCETNFPTKYQYQRHQCEFNAEKVVLKPDADLEDINQGMRIKYDCDICGKQFVSKNNLERHRACHENSQDNICVHCNKQFVSENRLKIHKENHCKKLGDISKFYRSDVAVWKCKKCHEVFSSLPLANLHSDNCDELVLLYDNATTTDLLPSALVSHLIDDEYEKTAEKNYTNVEKIQTEILLQCEFCNRTYADKNLLLTHQRKHTTEKNYECVNCKSVFESYAMAAQHWMKICTETANNTFYLPKLTYCEYCDRTFKSHELLYIHKIKKKHYTFKLHQETDEHNQQQQQDKLFVNSAEAINKLIEDVLITLDRPINKNLDNNYNNNSENEQENIVMMMETNAQLQFGEPQEKKRRGRKRKWAKQQTAIENNKRLNNIIMDGFKYQCERCVLVWDTVYDLDRHREKEHAASFSCEDCGQILHSAKALLIHCRAHKCLKPYVCDTCGRSYSQTSHLWQHMRFHQGIKPFACPHEGCEARYTIRPDLKDHIRKVHTRERPFKCTVCNKCFLTGSVYYQHRLIHTNDRRYGCDVCNKRFFRADALNNHKRIHTDERPYPCTFCGREFRQKGDRNKHVKSQHEEPLIIE